MNWKIFPLSGFLTPRLCSKPWSKSILVWLATHFSLLVSAYTVRSRQCQPVTILINSSCRFCHLSYIKTLVVKGIISLVMVVSAVAFPLVMWYFYLFLPPFLCPSHLFFPSVLSFSCDTSSVSGLTVCWQETHWQAPRPFWGEPSFPSWGPRRDSVTANPLWRLGSTICLSQSTQEINRRSSSFCICYGTIDSPLTPYNNNTSAMQ